MKVRELIEELKKENQNAPVQFWHEDKGYIDIICSGQNKDELDYQIDDRGLTKEQAVEKVCVELNGVSDE
tara:strand:- start:903 stop:1112 length:210 start_codon:yes stop_codon:yes gene_type:complete